MSTAAPDPAPLLPTFGVTTLRPPQRAAYDALHAGRDVLIVMPTGGGKSLCYQLPAVSGLKPALVVSPLVALMKDQVDALRRRGIRAAQLTSVASPAERERVWGALAQGELTLLYLAPEALESRATLDRLAAARPRLLAIDEAHCISEWGESFRPSYLRLRHVRAQIGDPPAIALTATATHRTRREIIDRVGLREPLTIVSGFDRPNLFLAVRRVAGDAERDAQLSALGLEGRGAAVYYAPTRRATERLAAMLRRRGVAARAYHAGLDADERARVQDAFLDNRIGAIVATCAFGMGVDKPDVRLVVHAAPAPSLEAYYQEAGRAGRDGEPGFCLTLLAPNDIELARRRLSRPLPTIADVHRAFALLRDETRRRRATAGTEGVARAGAVGGVARRGTTPSSAPRWRVPALATAGEAKSAFVGSPSMPRVAASLAVEILVDAHLVRRESGRHGTLRLLTTATRLATDRSIAPADVAFAHRLIEHFGSHIASGVSTSRQELAALGDATIAIDRALARLASSQLLHWSPPPQRLLSCAEWDQEAVRLALHQREQRRGRDLWRFGVVARFLTVDRCRRLILLRYFGDDTPRDSCGQCDMCRGGA